MVRETATTAPPAKQPKARKRKSVAQASAKAAHVAVRKAVRKGQPEIIISGSQVVTRGFHVLGDLTHFGEVYRAEPTVRIVTIKHGVKADAFARIARSMDRSKEQLGETLGLSVTTVDRKAKAGETLSSEQGERLVGVARLIGQVQTMVEQSGDPEGFNAARWLGRWLDEPLPALGGKCPGEFMDTAEGRALVSNLLAMAQSGAYA